jgi:hypothetical protein
VPASEPQIGGIGAQTQDGLHTMSPGLTPSLGQARQAKTLPMQNEIWNGSVLCAATCAWVTHGPKPVPPELEVVLLVLVLLEAVEVELLEVDVPEVDVVLDEDVVLDVDEVLDVPPPEVDVDVELAPPIPLLLVGPVGLPPAPVTAPPPRPRKSVP